MVISSIGRDACDGPVAVFAIGLDRRVGGGGGVTEVAGVTALLSLLELLTELQYYVEESGKELQSVGRFTIATDAKSARNAPTHGGEILVSDV